MAWDTASGRGERLRLTTIQRLPIRLRLSLWFALLLLVTFLAAAFLVLASLEGELHREIDQGLWLRASRVERAISAVDGARLDSGSVPRDLLTLTPLDEFASPGIYVEVLDQDGALLAGPPSLRGGELPVTPDMVGGALAGRTAYATLSLGSERVRVLLRPIENAGGVIGVVVVGESLHLLDAVQRTLRQSLIVAAAAAALGCLIGGWWLTGRALHPVAEVSRITRQIRGTGRFDQHITEPPADDELRELTVTFNEMLLWLNQTLSRQREFLADASHELRGPLAVLRGNLNLLMYELPEQERAEALVDAVEAVERMASLISDLLFLAEVDAREIVDRQPVALDEVVLEVWQRAKQLDDGSHDVVLGENDPALVLGDRERLVQTLWSLVENALRYTPPGGRVAMSLRAQGKRVELMVTDTGCGISSEHLPHIFDRFYRVDRARTPERGSTGLGLTIVKQSAEAHGGEVRVRSVLGEGSVFTVALPMGPPTSWRLSSSIHRSFMRSSFGAPRI